MSPILLNQSVPQLAKVKHKIHFVELGDGHRQQLLDDTRGFLQNAGINVRPNQKVVVQDFYEKAKGASIHYAVVISTNESVVAMCIHCNSTQPHM